MKLNLYNLHIFPASYVDWLTILGSALVFAHGSASTPNGLLILDLVHVYGITETTATWITSFQLCFICLGGWYDTETL